MANNNDNRQQQGGSGSAEQTDRNRDEQKLVNTNLTDDERSNIASQIGEKEENIANLGDIGAQNGRDDLAGGSGDGMEDESSREETDTF